jgi:hypothetical protein
MPDYSSGVYRIEKMPNNKQISKKEVQRLLKKKLIEDLINYDGFLSQKGDGDSTLECPKSEIIDLINKRFGKNE